MNRSAEEQLESRIVRHLDGELSAGERAELYRAVLRDPQAHRTLDAYAENDRVAAEALRCVCGEPGASHSLSLPAVRGVERPAGMRRREHGSRWLAVAAAVALLASVTWIMVLRPHSGSRAADPRAARDLHPRPALPAATPAALPPAVSAIPRDAAPAALLGMPQRNENLRDRSLIGVFDDAQNQLYLWEVERQETQIQVVKADL